MAHTPEHRQQKEDIAFAGPKGMFGAISPRAGTPGQFLPTTASPAAFLRQTGKSLLFPELTSLIKGMPGVGPYPHQTKGAFSQALAQIMSSKYGAMGQPKGLFDRAKAFGGTDDLPDEFSTNLLEASPWGTSGSGTPPLINPVTGGIQDRDFSTVQTTPTEREDFFAGTDPTAGLFDIALTPEEQATKNQFLTDMSETYGVPPDTDLPDNAVTVATTTNLDKAIQDALAATGLTPLDVEDPNVMTPLGFTVGEITKFVLQARKGELSDETLTQIQISSTYIAGQNEDLAAPWTKFAGLIAAANALPDELGALSDTTGLPLSLLAILPAETIGSLSESVFDQKLKVTNKDAEILQKSLDRKAEGERRFGMLSGLYGPNFAMRGITADHLGGLEEIAFSNLMDQLATFAETRDERERRSLTGGGRLTALNDLFPGMDLTAEQLGQFTPETFQALLGSFGTQADIARQEEQRAQFAQVFSQDLAPLLEDFGFSISPESFESLSPDFVISLLNMLVTQKALEDSQRGEFAAPRGFFRPFRQQVEV
jgi:hypothetical protein